MGLSLLAKEVMQIDPMSARCSASSTGDAINQAAAVGAQRLHRVVQAPGAASISLAAARAEQDVTDAVRSSNSTGCSMATMCGA
jgi:hypothetical protein